MDMPSTTAPEIQRTSLVGAVLYLKSLPLDSIDVLGFDYVDPPEVRIYDGFIITNIYFCIGNSIAAFLI